MGWQRLLGRGGVFPPAEAFGGSVLVLSEGENPSLAYFVRPFLAALGARCVVHDSRQPPPAALGEHAGVVVVRYLPGAWDGVLRAFREAGKPVAYFMDDDLMDAAALAGLPVDYSRKIRRLALSRRQRIELLCSEFWVSSPYLAGKYAGWRPRLLAARVDAATLPPAGALAPVTLCYHGTAAHPDEQRWLLPVVRELQQRCPHTQFSIVGNVEVNRLFRDVPRVTVLHAMNWPNYLAWTSAQSCDIALAPLLPGPFNAARSPTKFLDYTRLGAAGIYADVPPYRGAIRHDVDGLLVAMSAADWLAAITALVADPVRRQRLRDAARARLAAGESLAVGDDPAGTR